MVLDFHDFNPTAIIESTSNENREVMQKNLMLTTYTIQQLDEKHVFDTFLYTFNFVFINFSFSDHLREVNGVTWSI